MRTIYIDSDFKCHTVNDGTMTAVETDFFDGKFDAFVEGFCYKPDGNSHSIYAWMDYNELDAAQREYEHNQIAEYETALSEIETALGVTK